MLKAGTKIRTLYQYSETAVVLRKTKARIAADIRYWGCEEKAAAWYLIRWDSDGKKACCHRDMMVVRNDA